MRSGRIAALLTLENVSVRVAGVMCLESRPLASTLQFKPLSSLSEQEVEVSSRNVRCCTEVPDAAEFW